MSVPPAVGMHLTNVTRATVRDKTSGPFSDILIRFISRCEVEKRGRKYHRERLADALREEIETVVEGELGDPRIGLVSVSGVELAPDGRSARVAIAAAGDEREAESSLEGLRAATGYIRHELVENLKLRRAPELYFYLDYSQTYESRVDELLKRTKKRNR